MRIIRQVIVSVFLVIVFVFLFRHFLARSELTLASDGRPKAVIVLPAASFSNQPAIARQAAQVFSDHIFQISGARLPVYTEDKLGAVKIQAGRIVPETGKTEAKTFVLIGEGGLARQLGINGAGLGPGGILIKTSKNALILLGNNQFKNQGDLYAATAFLEDYLGCRYLWPGELGKVVPKQKTIVVPAVDYTFTPPIAQRGIRDNREEILHHEISLGYLGLTDEELKKARKQASITESMSREWMTWHKVGGDIGIYGGHAFGHLWEKYGKDHPDWFALQPDGTRDQSLAGNRCRLCKSNSGLIEAIAREKIAELDADPAKTCVCLSPNDGGYANFCMCANCRKLDPTNAPKVKFLMFDKVGQSSRKEVEYVSLADRMVHFWNAIAEQVTKVHPKALMVVDAYSEYTTPPVREKLHPNLVVRYVGGDDRDQWDQWRAKASKIYWRPNSLWTGVNESMLRILGRKHAEFIKHIAHNGVIATDIANLVNNWSGCGFNYYMTAKLIWNPDLDYDALLADYCRSGFGPAAESVKQYLECIERLTNDPAPDTGKYTKQVMNELRGYLDAAGKSAGDDSVLKKRVAFLRICLNWHDIQLQTARLYNNKAVRDHANPADARKLLDRRCQMMRDIVNNNPLAVNAAYVAFCEGDHYGNKVGWQWPAKAVQVPDAPKEPIADEHGRVVDDLSK